MPRRPRSARRARLAACAALVPLVALLAAPEDARAQVQTGGKSGGMGGDPRVDPALAFHVLERLTFGATGRDLDTIRRVGVDVFIREQLRPASIPENPVLLAKLAALPPATTPLDDPLWVWPDLYADYLTRLVYSDRQLNEVMTEFWTNHFSTSLDYANGGRTGFFTATAVDPTGTATVCYWDSKNTMGHCSTRASGNWSYTPIDTLTPVGSYLSLALDPTNQRPVVSYYEPLQGAGQGNLRVSRFDGTRWNAAIVDETGDVGTWTSIRVGSDGRARIAYRDVTNGALKLATEGPSGYTLETVDASGDVGLSASLALDASNRPGIAYWDLGRGLLKFASHDGSAWLIENVAPLPVGSIDLGQWPAPPALAAAGFDPATNRAVIAYHDTVTGSLRYATTNGTSWSSATVDPAPPVGRYPALAFHPATRRPAIAYHDAAGYALKLATSTGSAWSLEAVGAPGQIRGEWSSLAYSPAGLPLISTYNGSTLSADLAERNGTQWVLGQVATLTNLRQTHAVWEKKESDAFRGEALGCFRDLLHASATSPAMMQYLHNDQNTSVGGNEDYARELMELHTVGVTGGYTQADVEAVARAFAGWSTALAAPRCDLRFGSFCYNHLAHDGSPKTIVGVTFADDSANVPGNWTKQGSEILDMLARHPATARFVCGKLIAKFVADTPPLDLWDRCTASFLQSDGDIARVLEGIFFATEFRDPSAYLNKVKTPVEFTAGLVRHLEGETDGASLYDPMMYQGAELFRVPPPTGYDERGRYWVSGNSFHKRWTFGDNLLHGMAGASVNPAALALAAGVNRPDAVLDWFLERMVRKQATPLERQLLLDCLSGGDPSPLDSSDPAVDRRLRDVVGLIVGLPAYQKQ